MKTNPKIMAMAFLVILFHVKLNAQNWLTKGNKGTTSSSFLGTTDNRDLVFKTGNTERGRLINKSSAWRFGNSKNNAGIDSGGNLLFSGNATYRIGNNKYAILCNGMPQEGLFMNDDSMRWEFRDGKAFPFFTINNGSYDIATKGGLQVGNSNNAVAGNIRFNAGIFQGFDGTAWKNFNTKTKLQSPVSNDVEYENKKLQSVTDAQKLLIENLQLQLDALKTDVLTLQKNQERCNPCTADVLASKIPSNNSVASRGSSLQQNTPNPFNKSTVIKYILPLKFNTASIVIRDNNENLIIQQNISGAGNGLFTLNAGTLAASIYHYSLIIDGQIVNTKTMVLTR